MTVLRFVTWNLNWATTGQTDLKVRLLRSHEWDVAALQEVGRDTYQLLLQETTSDDALFTLGPRPADAVGRDKEIGVVLLARNGWRLAADPGALVQLPLVERGLVAEATRDGDRVWVCSWHSPNTVSDDREVKLYKIGQKVAAYRCLANWLRDRRGPTLLGEAPRVR